MTAFDDRLADARASYAAGLAGATVAVVASSLALGHWHRMLARPPRAERGTGNEPNEPRAESSGNPLQDK